MSSKKSYAPLRDFNSVLSILNKIAIFAGLSQEQLYLLFKTLQKVSYEKDEVIFRQGDFSSHIYIIESGAVKLYLGSEERSFELIEFGVGDCFGETSLIGIEPHTANAIASQKAELIVLSNTALLSLYNIDKDAYIMIILNIAREVSRRLNKTDNILLHYVKREE